MLRPRSAAPPPPLPCRSPQGLEHGAARRCPALQPPLHHQLRGQKTGVVVRWGQTRQAGGFRQMHDFRWQTTCLGRPVGPDIQWGRLPGQAQCAPASPSSPESSRCNARRPPHQVAGPLPPLALPPPSPPHTAPAWTAAQPARRRNAGHGDQGQDTAHALPLQLARRECPFSWPGGVQAAKQRSTHISTTALP